MLPVGQSGHRALAHVLQEHRTGDDILETHAVGRRTIAGLILGKSAHHVRSHLHRHRGVPIGPVIRRARSRPIPAIQLVEHIGQPPIVTGRAPDRHQSAVGQHPLPVQRRLNHQTRLHRIPEIGGEREVGLHHKAERRRVGSQATGPIGERKTRTCQRRHRVSLADLEQLAVVIWRDRAQAAHRHRQRRRHEISEAHAVGARRVARHVNRAGADDVRAGRQSHGCRPIRGSDRVHPVPIVDLAPNPGDGHIVGGRARHRKHCVAPALAGAGAGDFEGWRGYLRQHGDGTDGNPALRVPALEPEHKEVRHVGCERRIAGGGRGQLSGRSSRVAHKAPGPRCSGEVGDIQLPSDTRFSHRRVHHGHVSQRHVASPNRMISGIRDIDGAVRANRHAFRCPETRGGAGAVGKARFTQCSRQRGHRAQRGNFANQYVAVIRNEHVPRSIQRQSEGIVEARGPTRTIGETGNARRPRQRGHRAIRSDLPDGVVAVIGHV